MSAATMVRYALERGCTAERGACRCGPLLQSLEEHDVGVGGHSERDHQPGDAGERERVAERDPGERDERHREDRPERHPDDRDDAEQPVVEEQVEEEQQQTHHAGDHTLLQRFLAEGRAHRQGLELRSGPEALAFSTWRGLARRW
jgi:hypothetical protein